MSNTYPRPLPSISTTHGLLNATQGGATTRSDTVVDTPSMDEYSTPREAGSSLGEPSSLPTSTGAEPGLHSVRDKAALRRRAQRIIGTGPLEKEHGAPLRRSPFRAF